MKKKTRNFCTHCGKRIALREEEGTPRDYCPTCKIFFYENPLPVASSLLVEDRRVLLVKRGRNPYRGKWCLPTGFAEIGESIEEAAIRELAEETGVQGRIVKLVDADSQANYFYGDLLFVTFEVKAVGGRLAHGGDSAGVKYFPVEKIPQLAFRANAKAVRAYIDGESQSWAIEDSFRSSVEPTGPRQKRKVLLSDRLLHLVETHADQIARKWHRDVLQSKSTVHYHTLGNDQLFSRVDEVLAHFGKWLGGYYSDRTVQDFFVALGRERKREGFKLSEVLSALSLTKKHIWEFALSRRIWHKTLDIYATLELDRRIVLFFDRAAFYTTRGFEG
jgi:8-oxo-dGTP diphosphatase